MDRDTLIESPPGETGEACNVAPIVLFRDAPLGLLAVDQTGLIRRSNQRTERMFGYSAEELTNQPVDLLFPAHDGLRLADLVSRLFRRSRMAPFVGDVDLVGLTKAGRAFPVGVRLSAASMGGESVAITWLMPQEEASEHRGRFRRAIEAAPNGVLLVDDTGSIVLANAEAAKLFGYEKGELAGQQVEILVPKRLAAQHPRNRAEYAEAPRQRSMGHGRELFGLRKDGSEFPVEIGLAPIETAEGLLTMSTIVDITARRDAEMELRRTNEELLEFAYSASHDLKAPLATIAGLTELALMDLDDGDPDEARKDMRSVQERVTGLSKLVEEVLALARADRVEEATGLVSAPDLLAEMRENFATDCAQAGVEWRVRLGFDGEFRTQPVRLSMILRNLISNAIKYRDPSRTPPFLLVEVARATGLIVLRVSDNGLGIPARRHGEVFGMFRRFHGGEPAGSGLGLAMVKKQVGSLGGSIAFESEPGRTVFTVCLPERG